MIDYLVAASIIMGTFFCFVAAFGVLRMPDVFLRVHVSTKASTMGIIFLGLALVLNFQNTAVFTRCLMIVVFLFLTAPVSAHLIARAARKRKNPMSARTVVDEYKG